MKLNSNGWGLGVFLLFLGMFFLFLLLIAAMANDFEERFLDFINVGYMIFK